MNLIKNIFSKKDKPVRSYDDFWNWFQKNERTFFDVVSRQGDIEKEFDRLFSKSRVHHLFWACTAYARVG